MSTVGGPNIENENLVIHLDAANPKSYTSGSSVWNDLSGNENNGSVNNNPEFDEDGKGSLSFDSGSSQSVVISNDPSFDVDDNFTFGIVYKSTNWISGNQEGLVNKNGINGYSAYLRGTGGDVSFYTDGSGFYAPGPAYGGDNIWHHSIYVFSFSELGVQRIYQDGNLSAETAVTASITSNDIDLRLAWDTTVGAPKHFNGKISLFYFYNKVLTEDEIQQNFNSQKSRFNL